MKLPEPNPEVLAEAEALAARAELPARSGRVCFGTAGWTDKTLIQSKTFYPEGAAKPQARLEHYAQHFPMVEVDATYYTLLSAQTTDNWVRWTPPTFRFDVKAHPVFTGHPIDASRLPRELREACAALTQDGVARVYPRDLPKELRAELERQFWISVEPLTAAGKLGCVMFQFPPWFRATRGNARRIEALAERCPTLGAVEFRHRSWLEPERRQRVFELLRATRFAYVCVDEPEVERGGVPPLAEVTNAQLAVARFHGHNMHGWTRRGASVHERFDYLYRPSELVPWVDKLKRLAANAEQVHAVFNNCVRNYAVLGAKGLSVLLERSAESARSAT